MTLFWYDTVFITCPSAGSEILMSAVAIRVNKWLLGAKNERLILWIHNAGDRVHNRYTSLLPSIHVLMLTGRISITLLTPKSKTLKQGCRHAVSVKGGEKQKREACILTGVLWTQLQHKHRRRLWWPLIKVLDARYRASQTQQECIVSYGALGIHGSWTGCVGQVSRWVWQDGRTHTHTHTPKRSSVRGIGNGKRQIKVAGPEPGGQRYLQGAGRRMVGEPESDVVQRERQTATGTGRRKPGSATTGFVVGDHHWFIDMIYFSVLLVIFIHCVPDVKGS